jgi:hypothetical protein
MEDARLIQLLTTLMFLAFTLMSEVTHLTLMALDMLKIMFMDSTKRDPSQHAPHLVAKKAQSLTAMIAQASTQTLRVLTFNMEHTLVFLKDNQFQLVTQLVAKLLLKHPDGTFQPCHLKFMETMVSTLMAPTITNSFPN